MKRKKALSPSILHANEGAKASRLKVVAVSDPLAATSIGALGIAVRVTGERRFEGVDIVVPVESARPVGIDPASIRMFRVGTEGPSLVPQSGMNVVLGYAWARIVREGTYSLIGLPRDRMLQALFRMLIQAEASAEGADQEARSRLRREVLEEFLSLPDDLLEDLRLELSRLEDATMPSGRREQRPIGRGGHLAAYPLPHGQSLGELRETLARIARSNRQPPEVQLLLDEQYWMQSRPWPTRPDAAPPTKWIDPRVLEGYEERFPHLCRWFPWLCSPDWWMYQHDVRHTGYASGYSDLRKSTVCHLYRVASVSVDGDIITKPSIADGKIYVGTSQQNGSPGGTLYKVDLFSGTIEGQYTTSGASFYPYHGIGGSPAIVEGRAFVTNMGGKVYCIDTSTMTPVWITDLRTPDSTKNQPVSQPQADCWSSPLVVDGKVYVGCGEGESASTYGFVFCLDSDTGLVIWLYCTSKFQNRTAPGLDNAQNTIPQSVASAAPWVAVAGFTIQPDPLVDRSTGCSVWSSCAHDAELRRIYVGTGNSQYSYGGGLTGTEAPDKFYGSGLLSLDADTGAFEGFFSPQPDDSYWPLDSDIDVPGSPTIVSLHTEESDGSDDSHDSDDSDDPHHHHHHHHHLSRAVAFGTKSGACFLLDPATLAPIARRQMLPRKDGSGIPGDRGTGIAGVVPTGGSGENPYGIFGTPAFHPELGVLYVGLGGYHGLTLDVGVGINPTSTPFLRGVRDDDLTDLWPSAKGADGITRYLNVSPPMYRTREVGLSSPAVVNDVVFVSTGVNPYEMPPLQAGLYALAADSGLCLWSAGDLPSNVWCLGPAVSGDYVVVGAGSQINIYTLWWWWTFPWPWYLLEELKLKRLHPRNEMGG